MVQDNIKEEFSKVYDAFVDTKNQISEMNKGLKDIIKVLAKKMEVKPASLTKAFNYKYKKAEKGEDIIADIQQVLEEIEAED